MLENTGGNQLPEADGCQEAPISLLDPETRNLSLLHFFLMALSASFLGTWGEPPG